MPDQHSVAFPYFIVDVFSDEVFGGNQLAVLPRATGLSSEGMLKVAQEFGFSESVFVLPTKDAKSTPRVRIFAPTGEMDFAGHPSVGVACALVGHGLIEPGCLILQENIGPVPVEVSKQGGTLHGMLTNTSPLEMPNERPAKAAMAEVLSLDEDNISDSFFAGVGVRFCFVRLTSEEAVDRARLDKVLWQTHLEDAWASNVFFFSENPADPTGLYARMSAPAMGVDEDAASGSAVAALVGAIGKTSSIIDGEIAIHVRQGVAMGRPSLMTANAVLKNNHLVSVSVGGMTSLVATGEINVPRKYLN